MQTPDIKEKPRRGMPPDFAWDDEWLDQLHEPVIDSDIPIVDSHHHFWDRFKPYLLDAYLADMRSGHNVTGSVYAECGFNYSVDSDPQFASLGEIEFANGVGAAFASNRYGATRMCAGIVGKVDLRLGRRAGEILEAAISRAPERFKGIRQMAAWDESPEVNTLKKPLPPNLLEDLGLRAGLKEVTRLGLSFDTMVYHPQLLELAALADAFSKTTIIVDHYGGLVRVGPYALSPEETFDNWANNMRELARRPNVFMKVGGLGMRSLGFDYADRELPPTSEELAYLWGPVVETCIEAFGPARVMFESNFPVDRSCLSYRVLWNTYKRIVANYSAEEKRQMFAGTAIRAYRLPQTLGG